MKIFFRCVHLHLSAASCIWGSVCLSVSPSICPLARLSVTFSLKSQVFGSHDNVMYQTEHALRCLMLWGCFMSVLPYIWNFKHQSQYTPGHSQDASLPCRADYLSVHLETFFERATHKSNVRQAITHVIFVGAQDKEFFIFLLISSTQKSKFSALPSSSIAPLPCTLTPIVWLTVFHIYSGIQAASKSM